MGDDDFHVDVDEAGGVTVVRLAGALDLHAASQFEAALDAAALGARSVVEFHLDGLTFIDSTGLRCLVLVAARVERAVLVNPTGHVEKVIKIGGLASTFAIERR